MAPIAEDIPPPGSVDPHRQDAPAPGLPSPSLRAGRVLGLVLALQALRAPEQADTHKV